MTAEEIDSLAQRKAPLPEEYNLIEYGLYARLCSIYAAYDAQTLPVVAAKHLKDEAITEFEKWSGYRDVCLNEALRRKHIGNIMSEANKSGCPVCRKVARVYDGREQ